MAAGALAGVLAGALALPALAGGLQPVGEETPLTRGIPGDQVNPALVVSGSHRLMFWQDAAADGDGLGLSGVRLTESLTAAGPSFRLNEVVAGDQENVVAVALADGSVFCAWQSGRQGFQKVVGRILEPSGLFRGPEFAISGGDGEHQLDPAVAVLADGSVMVAWSSYRQDGGYAYDVFGRRVDASGALLGEEFRLNGTTGMNRRSPALIGLPRGGYLAAWVAERQTGVRNNTDASGRAVAGAGAPVFEVNVVARPFTAEGQAAGAEQTVSLPGAVAAHPVLAALPDGRIASAWTKRTRVFRGTGLDVASRLLNASGVPVGPELRLNSTATGDQYRPRLSSTAYGLIGVWSSIGQDGSWEGVFARWISADGVPEGEDIPVNTQTGGGQILPAVASVPGAELVVAWSSSLPRTGYEVFAQRLVPLLLRAVPSAGNRLSLRWPTVPGASYQLQSSREGKAWVSVGGPRVASGPTDEVEVSVSGQSLLYRVVRVQ